MFNVLVTGSHGFLGATLLKELSGMGEIKVYEYCRNDTDEHLIECLTQVDFLFHLAGEVRPTSTDSEFLASNALLTVK